MSRDYFSEFETQQEKLEILLEENDLLHEFDTERYPITLTSARTSPLRRRWLCSTGQRKVYPPGTQH